MDVSTQAAAQEELVQQFKGYSNPFSSMLIESKNLIFRGAPGNGKSYLAKEIPANAENYGAFVSEMQEREFDFRQVLMR